MKCDNPPKKMGGISGFLVKDTVVDMVQKSHSQPPDCWDGAKTLENHGINPSLKLT